MTQVVPLPDKYGTNELFTMSLAETTRLLERKELSALELVEASIVHNDESRDLNAYITTTFDLARDQAAKSDARRRRGEQLPLDGLPLAVKDNFCTQGIQTTAGSRILKGFVPPYESTVTSKLWAAGAVMLGKTNMDEFGMGSSTENSYWGPTINPRGLKLGRPNLAPGGSSGGSAAAVAANLCLASVGTDTGGSLRQPASFCGVVGMKPTYGLCSRWGIVAYASSLDQAGTLTKTVQDSAILFDVIVGHDEKDSTSIKWLGESFTRLLGRDLTGLRIGIPNELRSLASTADIDIVWKSAESLLAQAGADVVEVSVPSIRYSLPAYYVIALSEASSNLARYDGVRYGYRAEKVRSLNELYEVTRSIGFGEETKKRILLGTFALSSGYYDQYYLKAQKVRRLISDEFARVFEDVAAVVWPTTPTAAFEFGSHSDDPISMYLEDVFTVPVNLAGLPAISIPISQSAEGLPLGLQIIGPRCSDDVVFQIADVVEKQILT